MWTNRCIAVFFAIIWMSSAVEDQEQSIFVDNEPGWWSQLQYYIGDVFVGSSTDCGYEINSTETDNSTCRTYIIYSEKRSFEMVVKFHEDPLFGSSEDIYETLDGLCNGAALYRPDGSVVQAAGGGAGPAVRWIGRKLGVSGAAPKPRLYRTPAQRASMEAALKETAEFQKQITAITAAENAKIQSYGISGSRIDISGVKADLNLPHKYEMRGFQVRSRTAPGGWSHDPSHLNFYYRDVSYQRLVEQSVLESAVPKGKSVAKFLGGLGLGVGGTTVVGGVAVVAIYIPIRGDLSAMEKVPGAFK